MPYWASDAGFLPVYYDRHKPPSNDKWQVYVSEPHCTAVSAPLASHFLRGTIYLQPPQ